MRKFISQGLYLTPKILVWNGFFSSNLKDRLDRDMLDCRELCYITDRRQCINTFDAVVFHIRNLDLSDLPHQRFPKQFYVFYSLESPPNSGSAAGRIQSKFFNLTMTYKRDSDVWTPYDSFEEITNATQTEVMNSWDKVALVINPF